MKFDAHKVGLSFGLFSGLLHLVWAVLVATSGAQDLVDWIFELHFIEPVYIVSQFSVASAVLLIVLTTVVGYAVGFIFAKIWNMAHGK